MTEPGDSLASKLGALPPRRIVAAMLFFRMPVTAQPPDAPSILDLAVSALVVKLTRAFYYAGHQIPAHKRERGGAAENPCT